MIVIPMAGRSRRFSDAGYQAPKYMLNARGRSVFAHAVESFAAYAANMPFLFILRDVAGSADFVRRECEALGIAEPRLVVLNHETRGQADTVALGLREAGVVGETPITIFNIDTFRPGFIFPPAALPPADGYLEVFKGEGANWSYVRPATDGSHRVLETAEKRPISDLCCTGLYHFRSADLFLQGFTAYESQPTSTELYVAPMYNILIARGANILFHQIARDEVIFCGVPSEFQAFCAGED